ncbi:TlpA family protein disulfide reductase [Fulvivirga lutea]|uniref:TlpA family protein disulfide reductase n=1 Tax=Fulvivirga lutea TaxID=2810512 RepID=A0A974WJY7_9BACT|nr:TlpA family protein disulfide reductase [Fulvivirga lutea]
MVLVSVACSTKEQANTPQIDIKTLSGESSTLEDYEGKVVFLNIWATWCAPCIKEMPSIEKLTELYGDDVEFLIASNEEVDKIIQFKEKKSFKLNFVQLQNTPESLGVFALPATFVFNRAGELAFEEKGSRNWYSEESKSQIKKIITDE